MKKKASKTKLLHIVILRMGDWSHDGHGWTETVCIETNLTINEVCKAYDDGVKVVGLDLTKNVACDYEEPYIYAEEWKKLEAAGLTLEQLYGAGAGEIADAKRALSDDENITIYENAFVNAWLFVAKQGNPNFEYNITEEKQPIIEIGGYGLFSP